MSSKNKKGKDQKIWQTKHDEPIYTEIIEGWAISYRYKCKTCKRHLPVDYTRIRLEPMNWLCGACWQQAWKAVAAATPLLKTDV